MVRIIIIFKIVCASPGVIENMNNASTPQPSVTITIDAVLAQTSTAFKQFGLSIFTHNVWINPWNVLQPLSEGASGLEPGLITSISYLDYSEILPLFSKPEG